MKVQLLTNISGPDNVHGYINDVLDVPAAKAEELIAAGAAEPVEEE